MKNFLIKIALRFLPCAFDATNMNRLQLGTMTAYYYKSTVDAIAAVAAADYFNDISDSLNNGDVIVVSDTNLNLINTLGVTSADGAASVTTAVAIT